VKREKFIERCARRSGSTVDHVLEFHEIVRCDCGANKCPGWRAVYKFGGQRRREA
jgi:hypothetical protein